MIRNLIHCDVGECFSEILDSTPSMSAQYQAGFQPVDQKVWLGGTFKRRDRYTLTDKSLQDISYGGALVWQSGCHIRVNGSTNSTDNQRFCGYTRGGGSQTSQSICVGAKRSIWNFIVNVETLGDLRHPSRC